MSLSIDAMTIGSLPTVRGVFEAGGLQGVLHLLSDDREIAGGGESELLRGACWVGPIREVAKA